MDCALCGRFIWKLGGAVDGKSVCHACVKALAEQDPSVELFDEDAAFDGIYEDVRMAVDHAVEDAVDDALRKMRRPKAKGAA